MRWLRLVCAVAMTGVVPLGLAQADPGDESAEDQVFSGPQTGEKLPPFKVRGVYGDAAGQDLDFVAQADGGPLALVFVHERTRPTFGVVRALIEYGRQRKDDESTGKDADLTLGVIWLTNDATETEKWLNVVRQHLEDDAPISISLDGAEGPGAYGLNRNVALTVLVGKDGRVTANFALVQPSLQADLPKILAAIVEVAGGPNPDLSKLGVEVRQAARNAAELPDEVATMLRRLIRKDADDAQVARAARELEAQFETQKDAGPQVGRIARRIMDAGKLDDYGTPKAREHLKAWAEKYAPGAADRQSPKSDRQED